MTKKINRLTYPFLVSVIAILVFSSWLFGPVAPVDEFQDLLFNEIVIDSTIGAVDAYDETTYESCISDGDNFAAGDKLYRVTVTDSGTYTIEFEVLDTSDLSLFLMSSTIDQETQTECPDSCISRLDGSDNLEVDLLPGIYWISVDGIIASGGPGQGEGHFQLAVRNKMEYGTIDCGMIIHDQTIGKLSNYDVLDYATCIESLGNTYQAGDRIYRFDVFERKSVLINLEKLDNPGIHLFLLAGLADIVTGEISIFVCLGKSDTGESTEQISAILNQGVYFIVVDGGSVEDEGSFNLSISCPNDYETITCGEVVMGNTIDRINYHTADDYAACAPGGIYDGGDLTYRFDLANPDNLTFTLTPTEGDDLDLILISSQYDDLTMEYTLDTCIAISDTSLTGEKITIQLDSGTYFIVVDGALMENDTASEGPFMLEVRCASLPIELVSFNGSTTSEGIMVHWATASEIGFEGFHLQRSESGEAWNNLYWQSAKGSPTSFTEYSYLDAQPLDGANFYRLRSVDLDGTVNISSIIQVSYHAVSPIEFTVFPTLARDYVNVQGVEPGTLVKYEIRSVLGALLLRGTLGADNERLDLSEVTPGLVYLTLSDGRRFKTLPIRKI